jgi:RNA polymerase sigma factor (sigma-70 family)
MATAAPAPRDARTARAEALAERLYAIHRTRLLAIAKRNSASIEDAEEALQDAFILFIDHFDPNDDSPPLAWITLTLKRRCWALYKHQRHSWARAPTLGQSTARSARVESLADWKPRPDEVAELNEDMETMRHRLASLKPDQREALGFFALGYSYHEICDITGWTYTKVNRCISEGRAGLRELAARHHDALSP